MGLLRSWTVKRQIPFLLCSRHCPVRIERAARTESGSAIGDAMADVAKMARRTSSAMDLNCMIRDEEY